MKPSHHALDAPLARVRIVLVEPGHGGNVGACARAMRVMGLFDLVLVRPRVAEPAADPEAIAFASGATDVLAAARRVDSLDEALADVTLAIAVSAAGREFAAAPVAPGEAARLAWDELAGDPAQRVAFVFGTERTGLSITQAQRCQRLTSIPGDPGYHSLNLAQAVQIVAWELRRTGLERVDTSRVPGDVPDARRVNDGGQGTTRPSPGPRFATDTQIEALFTHLERALVAVGFLDPSHPKKLMPRLRRLFGRTRLEAEEVDLLRGVCKEIERVARDGPRRPPGTL